MYRFSLFDSSLDTSLTKLRDSNRHLLFAYRFTLRKVLAVVCKRMQQLPTLLGPAVHRREKDTDHKTSMRVSGPNNVGRAMHYGSNIVGLRFGDQRTKKILRVVSSKVLLLSNFA